MVVVKGVFKAVSVCVLANTKPDFVHLIPKQNLKTDLQGRGLNFPSLVCVMQVL